MDCEPKIQGRGDVKDGTGCMVVEVGDACDATKLLDPRSANGSGQNCMGRGVPPLSEAMLSLNSEGKGGSDSRERLSVRTNLLQGTYNYPPRHLDSPG